MTVSCPHLPQIASLTPPKLSQQVHREECTQCFDNQDGEDGVDICLACFNGGCLDTERHHAQTHSQKTGHGFSLNVKRIRKPSKRNTDEGPPAKLAKLAIVEEREEDKYDHVTALRCWNCQSGATLVPISSHPKLKELSDAVMQSLSSARQSEVKAWEEEITACEHTLMLEQYDVGKLPASGLAHCNKCTLKENLWLCLTCGSLGCGRPQYGGLGGNGHGLAHYEETRHPISVKLGTITPEGTADIYCYQCNDSKIDPELATHLAAFGINVATQTKTEKSMTELQIEHNLKFDFSLTGEDGKALEPVFGPGLTGLSNLGNSCYMASVAQALFSLPAFHQRYYPTAEEHWATCTEPLPATCIDCQMHKLADGLLSGRYSFPSKRESQAQQQAGTGTGAAAFTVPLPNFQDGIRPTLFKSLIGKGHEEFATMRQQDAEEFLSYLLKVLQQHARRVGRTDEADEPFQIFRFGMEQRLKCGECQRVRYRVDEQYTVSVPVPAQEKGKDEKGNVVFEDVKIEEALEALTGEESLEYQCPGCKKEVVATKRTRFASFPQALVVHAKKFQLVNWVPTKLDVPLIIPSNDEIILDPYVGTGLQPGEVQLPEDSAAPAAQLPTFNEAAIAQLEGMGFPTVRCQKALLATGNADAEAAMEWLFAHMDDADIDDPIPTTGAPASASASTAQPEPSAEQVSLLVDMGFTTAQAKKALRETDGNAERAVEWLFNHPDDTGEDVLPPTSSSTSARASSTSTSTSTYPPPTLPAHYRLKAFISHKGPSVHSGHYVAHVRFDDGGWVLFNDEKVVRADEESVRELKQLAYLYIFERV